MTITQTNLAELYVSFFNRAPDSAGLAYWVDQLDKGALSLEDISKNWMSEQAEGLAKYPSTLTEADFITQIYQAALGRAPDAEGLAYWQAQLTNSSVGRDVFLAAVINGAKANSSAQGVLDAATLSNKATAGVAFADKGLNDLTLAGQVVASVNSNPATLAAAQAVIKLVPATAASVTPALITLLSKTFESIINLNAKAPGELGDLATYLTAVANQASGTTDLNALLASVSTTVTKAATDSSALDNPASLAGDAVTAATPSTGGGVVPATPTFTVIGSANVTNITLDNTKAEKVLVEVHATSTAAPVAGTSAAGIAAKGGTVELTVANLSADDLVKFTIGDVEQTFKVTTEATTADIAGAINADEALNLLVTASDVDGKLVLESKDVTKAITGSFSDVTPASTAAPVAGTSAAGIAAKGGTVELTVANLSADDLVKFTIGDVEQTFKVTTEATTADIAGAINADEALNLLVTASDVDGKLVLESKDVTKAITGSFSDVTPAHSDSAPLTHDVITNFSLTADKLDLPFTTLLNVAGGVGDLFVSTVDKGMVEFGGAVQGASYLEKAQVLLTTMGEGKLSAAFVMDGDTYVVQGDGVAGMQDTDILVKLVGINTVTDLSAIIV